MKIRKIVWDLGGVHVDFFPRDFLPHLVDPACIDELVENCFETELWQELDRGTLTEEQVIEKVKAVVSPVCVPHVERAVTGWIEQMEGKESLLPIVQRLDAAGYEQLILSNAGWRFIPFVASLPMAEYIPKRFFSCEDKLLKPEAAIYHAFEQRFGVVPHEILFIDDNIRNIHAARECGWNAVHYVEPMDWARVAETYGIPAFEE